VPPQKDGPTKCIKNAYHTKATMQTIPSRSATLHDKHSASRPCWLAATPTPFALPQTSAAAAPPATPSGGVATRPIAWGRPPPLRHPPAPLDAEVARIATGNNGGRRGRRRGGSSPPAACSSATVKRTAARSPACSPARGARPTRPSGPNGRHALMTTATRGNPGCTGHNGQNLLCAPSPV